MRLHNIFLQETAKYNDDLQKKTSKDDLEAKTTPDSTLFPFSPGMWTYLQNSSYKAFLCMSYNSNALAFCKQGAWVISRKAASGGRRTERER